MDKLIYIDIWRQPTSPFRSYTHTWSKPAPCFRAPSPFFTNSKLKSCVPIFVYTSKDCTNPVKHKWNVHIGVQTVHTIKAAVIIPCAATSIGWATSQSCAAKATLQQTLLSQFSSDQNKDLLLSVRGVGWEKTFLLRSVQPGLPPVTASRVHA